MIESFLADKTNRRKHNFYGSGLSTYGKKSSCDKQNVFHQTFLKEEIQTKYVTSTDTILIFWQPYQICQWDYWAAGLSKKAWMWCQLMSFNRNLALDIIPCFSQPEIFFGQSFNENHVKFCNSCEDSPAIFASWTFYGFYEYSTCTLGLVYT